MRVLMGWLVLGLAMLGAVLISVAADPSGLEILVKGEVAKLLPQSVFLDGERPPVQARNSVGARTKAGKVVLVTLIDTAGYAADYQEKYIGSLMTSGKLMVGGKLIPPGAYGLGHSKRPAAGKESHWFVLYDLGGDRVAEMAAEEDAQLRPVMPIQLRRTSQATRLYLGRHFVNVSAP